MHQSSPQSFISIMQHNRIAMDAAGEITRTYTEEVRRNSARIGVPNRRVKELMKARELLPELRKGRNKKDTCRAIAASLNDEHGFQGMTPPIVDGWFRRGFLS